MDRHAELQRIWQVLAAAGQGRGRVVLVTGEAGIGKTRLCTEVQARQPHGTALVLSGVAGAEPDQPALATVADSLRSVGPDYAERLWQALRPRASRLAAVLPEMARNAQQPLVTDHQLVFQTLLDAVAEAAGDGLVLWVLDELQRADRATWAFLWYASRHLAGRRCVLLAACRDDEVASAQRGSVPLLAMSHEVGVTEVRLERLGPPDMKRLVRGLTDVELPCGVVAAIVERSAGNPQAATELVEAALHGMFDRLPPSVQHAVALRSSHLSSSALELLEALAVGQPDADPRLLLSLPGGTEEALVELTESGLVHLVADRGRPLVRFRHPLYREAVYQRTHWVRRRLHHTRLADALERVDGGRDLDAVVVIARHRELGGDAGRAADSLSAAASAVRAAGEQRAADDLSLATLLMLDRNPGLAQPRAGVQLDAMHRLSVAGRWGDLLPIALRAWRAPSDPLAGERGQLAAILGASLLMNGRVDEAHALLATETTRLDQAGLALRAPSLLAAAAAAALNAGCVERARQLCELALQTAEPRVLGFARCLKAAIRFRTDRDREAAARAYGAIHEGGREEGLSEVAAFALWNRARMTTRMRDAARAETVGDRTYPLIGALSRLLTGTIHLLEGLQSRAAAALEQARAALASAVPLVAPLIDALQAHVDLHVGEVERARTRLGPWTSERPEVCSLSRALVLGAHGWLAWETGSLEVAAERWQECADECQASGYGLLESCQLLLPLHVDALARLGRTSEAGEAVRRAEASGAPDRFSRASLAAARFRLGPSVESWAEARQAAGSAPWPFLEAQLGCWCAEHLGNRSAALAALQLFSAIGARRGVERAESALQRPGTPAPVRQDVSIMRLSRRELQVAALVAEGLSNAEIAASLGLSVGTATTHVKHILVKLGFHSRAQVAAWISRERLRTWEGDVLLRVSQTRPR